MGSMDRNTVIGFVLLAALLFLYLFLSTKSSQDLQKQQQAQQDSIARVQRLQDSIRIATDTSSKKIDTAQVQPAVSEQSLTVENNVFKIFFTNKGGQPKKVELKNYKTFDSVPVSLGGSDFDKISYAINTGPAQASQAAELFFNPGTVTKNADNSQTIT